MMPGKHVKRSRKKNAYDVPGRILFIAAFAIIAVSAAAYLIISPQSSGMAIKSPEPAGSVVRIYDVNVPSGFLTVRNIGDSPVPAGMLKIYINGEEVECQETGDALGPGQTMTCTTPLVKYCRSILVTGPDNTDEVGCE